MRFFQRLATSSCISAQSFPSGEMAKIDDTDFLLIAWLAIDDHLMTQNSSAHHVD